MLSENRAIDRGSSRRAYCFSILEKIFYPCRNTFIGSVRDARNAGTNTANPATKTTSAITPANVLASELDTPYSIPDNNRADAIAITSPHAQPINATLNPCARYRLVICERMAPSASRSPISR